MAAILSGWWHHTPVKVITKRRKRLVDGRVYRVVEIQSYTSPKEITHIPIVQFNKHFKIDNTLHVIYDNCT